MRTPLIVATTLTALVLSACQGPLPVSEPGATDGLSPISNLPQPGPANHPRPTGAGGPQLTVLDWAGFEGAVSITLDDTQPSHVEHWPTLKATGVRMTWYMAPQWATGAAYVATWQDAVAQGHEIGNHTWYHPRYADAAVKRPSLTQAEAAAAELDLTDAYIRGTIGQAGVWTHAYPYGDTAWKAALGDRYLFARTVNNGLVTPGWTGDPLLLPTYMVAAGNTQATYDAKITQAADQRAWQTLLFHSLTPTAQNWYAGVPVADLVASLTKAKAEGRVWLDSVVNVGSYWKAARVLRAATPTVTGANQTWTWSLPTNFPPGRYLRVTVEGGTLAQAGRDLPWNRHGYYEVALDAGELTWRP